jgi:hypothetical protein
MDQLEGLHGIVKKLRVMLGILPKWQQIQNQGVMDTQRYAWKIGVIYSYYVNK